MEVEPFEPWFLGRPLTRERAHKAPPAISLRDLIVIRFFLTVEVSPKVKDVIASSGTRGHLEGDNGSKPLHARSSGKLWKHRAAFCRLLLYDCIWLVDRVTSLVYEP